MARNREAIAREYQALGASEKVARDAASAILKPRAQRTASDNQAIEACGRQIDRHQGGKRRG